MRDFLIDTCAAIWMLADEPLQDGAESRISDALDQGACLVASPVSAWEVGMLVARGRLTLPFSPLDWYAQLCGLPNITQARLTPKVLIDSSFLPGDPPRDPMDRMMISLARAEGLNIITRDRKILDYAAKGHVLALAC